MVQSYRPNIKIGIIISSMSRIKLSQTMHMEQGIWTKSPCSLNYPTRNTSIDSVPRFQIGSIYHKDEVSKPKKVFNQFEKPEILLHDFRRLIDEASQNKMNLAARRRINKSQQKTGSKSVAASTESTLYQVPAKIQFKYDRHGCRTSQIGDYDVKEIQQRVSPTKKFFSYGRRTDLSRPLNFYPGPGAYDYPKSTTLPLMKMSRTMSGSQAMAKHEDVNNPQTERGPLKKVSFS